MVRLMFETVVVTFGMFSALPMPRVDWTPRSMRWALACLPLVPYCFISLKSVHLQRLNI